jgi:hypothetical protein
MTKAEYHRQWYLKNRERILLEQKERYANDPQFAQRMKDRSSEFSRDNRKSVNARNRAYNLANPEKTNAWKTAWNEKNKEKVRAYSLAYAKRNRAKVSALTAIRRAGIDLATPQWVDRKELEKFYISAQNLTRDTGVVHHVDHIWPLRGKGFNGLHVPWNLQVLTAHENCVKSNRIPLGAL